jgi:hypothetical protein
MIREPLGILGSHFTGELAGWYTAKLLNQLASYHGVQDPMEVGKYRREGGSRPCY